MPQWFNSFLFKPENGAFWGIGMWMGGVISQHSLTWCLVYSVALVVFNVIGLAWYKAARGG